MAQPYLNDLRALIERLNIGGQEDNPISARHFFSGAAAYMSGQIFMSLSPVGLALKLSQSDCDKLLSQGAKPLRYFPRSPVKKGYVVLPPKLVDDNFVLKGWVLRCIDFAGQDSSIR